MKKIIVATLLILSLGAGLSATQILAASESMPQTTPQNAEQNLQEALKTQVALTKAKLSLIQTHAELQLEQNKAAVQHSSVLNDSSVVSLN